MMVEIPRKSYAQILELAEDAVFDIVDKLRWESIPSIYNYELNSDPATLELRSAIIRYINRMYDERRPYLQKAVKAAMTTIAKKPRPGAKGMVRNPNGRKGKAAN